MAAFHSSSSIGAAPPEVESEEPAVITFKITVAGFILSHENAVPPALHRLISSVIQ